MFTPGEKRVILFLIAAILMGTGVWVYKRKNPYFAPELDRAFEYSKDEGKEELRETLYKTKKAILEPKKEPKKVSKKRAPRGKININTASSDELILLPGIGPAYSQRIINYRKEHGGFKNKEELMKVKGIGKERFEKIKDKIKI
jgi:comEA protein